MSHDQAGNACAYDDRINIHNVGCSDAPPREWPLSETEWGI
jgi:hypothetical protein